MPERRLGAFYGVAAYLLWGLFPLYWPLLQPAGAGEILGHRIVWSLVFTGLLIAVGRQWTAVAAALRHRRTALTLTAAAGLIAINWGTYIYGVNNGFVVETSLGYFINPLVSVVLGVLVFGERLRRWQWLAVGIAALAVVVLTVDYGRPPWLALILAFSFGFYGLLKKIAPVGAVQGLAIESAALFVPALVVLVLMHGRGEAEFGQVSVGHTALMISAGVATAVPLLFFAAAARRVPLVTMGLLQYIAPSMQLALGVFVFREPMPPGRLAGFVLVWAALAVFTIDSVRANRRSLLAPQF